MKGMILVSFSVIGDTPYDMWDLCGMTEEVRTQHHALQTCDRNDM